MFSAVRISTSAALPDVGENEKDKLTSGKQGESGSD